MEAAYGPVTLYGWDQGNYLIESVKSICEAQNLTLLPPSSEVNTSFLVFSENLTCIQHFYLRHNGMIPEERSVFHIEPIWKENILAIYKHFNLSLISHVASWHTF